MRNRRRIQVNTTRGDRQIAAGESPISLSQHVSLLTFLEAGGEARLSPAHLHAVQISAVDTIIAIIPQVQKHIAPVFFA